MALISAIRRSQLFVAEGPIDGIGFAAATQFALMWVVSFASWVADC